MYVRVYVDSIWIYNNLIIEYHGLVLKELSQVEGNLFFDWFGGEKISLNDTHAPPPYFSEILFLL